MRTYDSIEAYCAGEGVTPEIVTTAGLTGEAYRAQIEKIGYKGRFEQYSRDVPQKHTCWECGMAFYTRYLSRFERIRPKCPCCGMDNTYD